MQQGSSTSASDGNSVQQVQETTQQQVQQVAQQAREMAGQAQSKIKHEMNNRSSQMGGQIQSTGEDLRTVGKQLREQGKETPAKVADQAADRVDQLGRYLTESDADKILHDIEDFARKQPWTVITGGLALGFVASRFLKASSGRRYNTLYNVRLPATQAGGVTGDVPTHTSTGPAVSSGPAGATRPTTSPRPSPHTGSSTSGPAPQPVGGASAGQP